MWPLFSDHLTKLRSNPYDSNVSSASSLMCIVAKSSASEQKSSYCNELALLCWNMWAMLMKLMLACVAIDASASRPEWHPAILMHSDMLSVDVISSCSDASHGCDSMSGTRIHSSGTHLSIHQIRFHASYDNGTGKSNSARSIFQYRSCMLVALNGTAPHSMA